jgi:hypothetical protein
MYDAVDITAPDASPAEDAARAHALFFVVYVVVGALFVMNLFVGYPPPPPLLLPLPTSLLYTHRLVQPRAVREVPHRPAPWCWQRCL